MIRIFLILTFISLAKFSSSQEDESSPPPDDKPKIEIEIIPRFKPSIQGVFKLPNAFANKAFKKTFNGVGNFELAYKQPFFKNFFIGGAMQISLYDMRRFNLPEIPNGTFKGLVANAEFGYQKYFNPNWYFTFSLRGGYGGVVMPNKNCEAIGEKPKQNMAFSEEMLGLYIMGNDRVSYGLVVSHQIWYFKYDPSWVCKTNYSGLSDRDYKGYSNLFCIGFAFNVYLGKEAEL